MTTNRNEILSTPAVAAAVLQQQTQTQKQQLRPSTQHSQTTTCSLAASSVPSSSSTACLLSEYSNSSVSVLSAVHDIVAGTAGGMATVIVGHPLDTVKVRQQSHPQLYPTMATAIAKTWREEGFRGYYKGCSSPLAGEGLFNAVQFLAYGRSKQLILNYNSLSTLNHSPGNQTRDLSIPQYFAAGAATGFASVFVECIVDNLKSKLQTQVVLAKPQFTTLRGAFKTVYNISGIRGLYHGLFVTFLRTMPSTAFYFGSYEWTLRQLNQRTHMSRADTPVHHILLAGSVGGVAYWLSTFPMDCVKSAIQCDAIATTNRRYKSTVDCIQQLWHEGGVKRFYRGLLPCLLRAAPANAACFLVYEQTLMLLK